MRLAYDELNKLGMLQLLKAEATLLLKEKRLAHKSFEPFENDANWIQYAQQIMFGDQERFVIETEAFGPFQGLEYEGKKPTAILGIGSKVFT